MLVIGVGNPLRGDDGIGPYVVGLLASRMPADVQLVCQSGEGTMLMQSWVGEDTVIVVDAVSSGADPGTIVRLDAVRDLVPAGFFRYSTHAFSLAEAVELSRALSMLPPTLVVYGIEGSRFHPGEGLDPRVRAAGDAVAVQIVGDLEGRTPKGRGTPKRVAS